MLANPRPDLILVERLGFLAIIRLNRPDKYNAITQDMYTDLRLALVSADRDADVRAVVISGVGKAFTAGNDLNDFAIDIDGKAPVQEFLRTIASISVPVIAAVNGLAVGVGVTMLLHCDLVYADPSASFQVPFVELGLVPEAASSLLLPQLIGARRSTELLLTGRKLTAIEAAAWGLINEATPTPLERAIEVGHGIAAKPPGAVRHTKTLSRSTTLHTLDRMSEEEAVLAAQLNSPEFTEVLTSRREKRKPLFDKRSSGLVPKIRNSLESRTGAPSSE
ncbi:enoyl-CoA hydratase-related protein [Antrihabitans sp. YC2-6]|uniref:enoyl-CoA hydratase-related protein n=1 Tax=Antrihabitans sp. YC2-6 TaxID=2799498 RepID=UPI0018F2D468|nr:enoyl-CoA hydratase-related protein [Antrihabitans sp. YC2-6]MBJ8346942.1 enoyl-CoA hydratase/isomerase family protein [Antrihabitans sp. YC2-6]